MSESSSSDSTGKTGKEQVLITGANGHLGCRLISRLAGSHQVRAIVRSERARSTVMALPEANQIDVQVIDYQDIESMTEAAMDCDYVVHLVGIIKETASASYIDAHEETTRCLIEALSSANIKRLVYVSILGSRPDSTNTCLASKGRAEQILLDSDIPALLLKVPMVLGEGDFASQALNRKANAGLNMVFRAASREQPIYAGDVVEAIVAGINQMNQSNQTVELAGPESMTRKVLIQRAAQSLGNQARVLSLPISLGMAMAFLLESLLANPPVTRAMLDVLDHDDDIDPAAACTMLDIELTTLEQVFELCLSNSK